VTRHDLLDALEAFHRARPAPLTRIPADLDEVLRQHALAFMAERGLGYAGMVAMSNLGEPSGFRKWLTCSRSRKSGESIRLGVGKSLVLARFLTVNTSHVAGHPAAVLDAYDDIAGEAFSVRF
jgi:hypothetical protein